MKILVLFVGLLPGLAASADARAATIEIVVHEVRSGQGQIRIGLCRKTEFLSEHCAYHAVAPARLGDVAVRIPDVAAGVYGVAAYQDLDGSGTLKRNFFGMPKEDVGFSRDPSLRFGPPSFADSALTIGNEDARIALTLRHFGTIP